MVFDTPLLVTGTIFVLFGLWQLDWAFWVAEINAFTIRIEILNTNAGILYLLMMTSLPAGIISYSLGFGILSTFLSFDVFAIAFIVLLLLVGPAKPVGDRILWWQFGSRAIKLSIKQWILLNLMWIFLGLAFVNLS